MDAGRVDGWERGGQLLLDFLALRRLLAGPEAVVLAELMPNAAAALVAQAQRLLHAQLPTLPEWGATGALGDAALLLPAGVSGGSAARTYHKSLALLNATLVRWLQQLHAACVSGLWASCWVLGAGCVCV